MRWGVMLAGWCAVGAALAFAGEAPIGSMPYVNHREPPSYLPLTGALADQYALGHAVFNTDFLAAGTPGAGRRAGLGPLFNSASCDECHNEGAHGRGPVTDGPVPNSMVVELEAPIPAGGGAAVDPRDPPGDPNYGHVFSPIAVDGFTGEGQVVVHYHVVQRTYPDGVPWTLRQPTYEFVRLNYGELASGTVIKPRLAPAIFGLGLLDSADGARQGGGFGWQAAALSIRDQTTRALAREMGVTSADRPFDDCTAAQLECLTQRHADQVEISPELLDALLTFEQWVAVPENPKPADPQQQRLGSLLFARTGCAGCHTPQRPVSLHRPDGTQVRVIIAPYTDLTVHDLGAGLADRDVAGGVHVTRWRTAPLWGMGYRLSREHVPTFLHDGRARSVEEAVLWHEGEAAGVRDRFMHLPQAQRELLLSYVAGL